MSTVIMAACWPLQMDASAKAVLISLADNANDAGECWPSIDTIAQRVCLHRSNVIAAIKRLESMGHLTADRSNGRHTRYFVRPNLDLFDAAPSRSATGSGTQPVAERDRSRSARTGSGALPDPSRSATKPVAERDSNRQEPSRTVTKSNRQGAQARDGLPEWLDADAWKDWCDYRGSRKGWTAKAKALSLGTLTRLRDAGEDPRAVIEQSIERGWTGLFPIRSNQPHGPPSRPSVAQQFAQKTYTGTPDDDLPEFLRTGTH